MRIFLFAVLVLYSASSFAVIKLPRVCAADLRAPDLRAPDLRAPAPAPRYAFNLGFQTADGTYLLNQPPQSLKRVPLNIDFMHFEMVSDLITPQSTWQPAYQVATQQRKSQAEWQARKDDLLFSLNFGVMRGPMVEIGPMNPNLRDLSNNGRLGPYGPMLVDPIRKILNPLYEAYAAQGPERAEMVPAVRRQDEIESHRFTRFVLSRFIKPMGYGQVLTSKDASENLHVSETWGDQVADLVRGRPGEVVGELGRLHIIHPNEYQFDFHRSNVDELMNEEGKLATNRIITHLLLQKMFSWINSDARLDRLLFQINLKVERVLKINQIPLELGVRRELSRTWENGTTVTEVIYMFDRAALLKMEEALMRKTLAHWLRYASVQPLMQGDHPIPLKFYANEYAVIRRMGFYEMLFPGKSLPKRPAGVETGFFIDQSQIPVALEWLERSAAL